MALDTVDRSECSGEGDDQPEARRHFEFVRRSLHNRRGGVATQATDESFSGVERIR